VTCKASKYSELDHHYVFQLVARESLWPMNNDTRKFLADLGRRIFSVSGHDKETSFFFQRISVLLCCCNSVLLLLVFDDYPDV